MSLIDSAFNAVSEIAKLVPGYGTAVSVFADLAREIWNIAEPVVSSLVHNVADSVTKDWPAEQKGWVDNAIDGVFN